MVQRITKRVDCAFFLFLHFIRPLGLHLCPHLSNIKRKLQDSGPQFHQLLAPRDEAVNYSLVAHPKMKPSEGSYALPVQQNSRLPTLPCTGVSRIDDLAQS